jgi:molybdopterin converting factor small subunit
MVDAELSDTKETVEYLKDEVGDAVNTVSEVEERVSDLEDDLIKQRNSIYRDMDGDYSDMKDYVKHRIQRHVRHFHAPLKEELIIAADAPVVDADAEHDNVIIMDDTCFLSDDDEDTTTSVSHT